MFTTWLLSKFMNQYLFIDIFYVFSKMMGFRVFFFCWSCKFFVSRQGKFSIFYSLSWLVQNFLTYFGDSGFLKKFNYKNASYVIIWIVGKFWNLLKNIKVGVFASILGKFIDIWYWKGRGWLWSFISLNSFDFMMKPDFCAFLNSRKLLIFKKTYFVLMVIWKHSRLILKPMLWGRDVESKNGKNITFGDSLARGGSLKIIWIN